MKRIYILFCLLAFTLSVTARDNRRTLQYHNVVLKEKGDSLILAFDLEFNPQGVKKNQSLIVIPTLQAGENKMTFPYLQFDGKTKRKTLKRTVALGNNDRLARLPYNYHESQVYGYTHYYIEVPYEKWMDEAVLYSNFQILGCANGEVLTENSLGIKVQRMPKAPAILPVIYIKPKAVIKERDMSGSAYLDFRKNSSEIDPSFRNNPDELKRIMSTVYQTRDDADMTIHNITITGYASPEGSFEHNYKLSQNRANSLKEYIRRTSTMPAHLFSVASMGEDWMKLKELIENSQIINKDRVLSIINNNADFDTKEQQIKALGATYHELLSDFFPALRRVDYRINFTVRDYTITEAQSLLNTEPSKLSSLELYLLAELYEPGSDTWNDIILLTHSLYPSDPEATINAAAVYINRKEFRKAKECLDKVRSHPDAQHNIRIYEEMAKQGMVP